MNPMISSLFDVLQQSIEGTLNEYISAVVSTCMQYVSLYVWMNNYVGYSIKLLVGGGGWGVW